LKTFKTQGFRKGISLQEGRKGTVPLNIARHNKETMGDHSNNKQTRPRVARVTGREEKEERTEEVGNPNFKNENY